MTENNNLKNSIIYLIIMLIFQKIQKIYTQPHIDYVFSPFSIKNYKIEDPQGSSTTIKIASKANLVFISAGFAGIYVIECQNNNLIYQ